MTKNISITISGCLAVIIGFIFLAANSMAQTAPELIITWQAKNYAPPGFSGKILPIRGSEVAAAVMLVDKGKVINLSQNEIRWFLNRRFEKSGVGLNEMEFSVSNIASGDISLKAEIRDYQGQNLEKSVMVQLAEPELIIDAPHPVDFISLGINLLKALPYFFNVSKISDLVFEWSANSQKTQGEDEKPDLLELEIPAGAAGGEIDLAVNASSKLNQLEFAGDEIRLKIR